MGKSHGWSGADPIESAKSPPAPRDSPGNPPFFGQRTYIGLPDNSLKFLVEFSVFSNNILPTEYNHLSKRRNLEHGGWCEGRRACSGYGRADLFIICPSSRIPVFQHMKRGSGLAMPTRIARGTRFSLLTETELAEYWQAVGSTDPPAAGGLENQNPHTI